MMKLQTPVIIQESVIKISFDDRIMVLGSCFADNIGKIMASSGFKVLVNPFGTIYNPISLMNSMERLESGIPFRKEECIEMGAGAGLICSFNHHTSFARPTAESFLDNANDSLEKASSFFKKCNKIIISLGTAWCYNLVSSGYTVSNCLKRNASEFVRKRMEISDVTDSLEKMLSLNKAKFIFTVSPIRHPGDGAHGNQLSKSTLLLAVDDICRRYPDKCEYFPSYEIMMDELRDYRFYAEDMNHPSAQATNYIWERFCDYSLSNNEKERLAAAIKEIKRSGHRPLHKNID
jgi:hypothetical protein